MPRSNSFNFVPVRDVARPPRSPCPLPASGEFARPIERALFLRLRDRMRLFQTTTDDFGSEELRIIKEELGQIYADVSSKLYPDDFARDLRKLALSVECGPCPHRPECGGCYSAVGHAGSSSSFERDDQHVLEMLRTLEGAILDVGCGEGPYLAEIAGQVEAGRATYVGLDPDEGRIRLLRSRYPWARYHVGTVADLAAESPRFDHLLVLRSYNHLPNPDVILRDAVLLLEPAGTLTVVDNVAFGLVRSREHAAAAERGPGEHEHHRNDSSVEAHELLGRLELELIDRRDVGPNTSNQWMLRYRKARPE